MSSQTAEWPQEQQRQLSAEGGAGRGRAGTVGVACASGLAGALAFLLVKNNLTDDAYITLAYAKNLAADGHWGLIPQETANSATSPLNVLLLGLAGWLTGMFGEIRPVFGLGMVTVGACFALGWGWLRLATALRLRGWVAVVTPAIGVLLVLANPFVLSAIGLEVLLVPAVLVWLTALAAEGRPVWFGAVAGVAVLTRLDLVVFVLVIALAVPAIRRAMHFSVLAACAVAAPWYVFSWFVLGSAVPDTLVIKQGQDALFGQWTYLTGPVMYLVGQMREVTFAFLPLLGGVLAVLGWLLVRFAARWSRPLPGMRPVLALGVAGVAYYLVYMLLGVGPYHWYYVPPIVSLSACLAAAGGAWLQRAREEERLRTGAPAVALGMVALLGLGNLANDLRHGVPWESPVIFGNWASTADYARVGTQLGQRLDGATVASPGEIGTIAYFCECAIVDEFADRGRIIDPVQRQIAEAGPVGSLLWRANYFWLNRSIEPRRVDYQLRYEQGPGSGPNTWQVHSAAKGTGHFTLVKAS